MEPVEAQLRSRSNCECLLVALALYGLAPGNASAGDPLPSSDTHHTAETRKTARLQIPAPSLSAPFAFCAPPQMPLFSPTEFRPRKPGLLEAPSDSSEGSVIDAPMLRDTSIARELSEAQTQDRVRLLTLWQSRASSLSLQAGKHGAPSLQWSTPWMHRDTVSRGLFDRLLLAAPHNFGGFGRGGGSRQAGAMAPSKPLDLATPISSQ